MNLEPAAHLRKNGMLARPLSLTAHLRPRSPTALRRFLLYNRLAESHSLALSVLRRATPLLATLSKPMVSFGLK